MDSAIMIPSSCLCKSPSQFLDAALFSGQAEPQKFVVMEFSNGGEDLEHITLTNAAQAFAVFWQVAFALAGKLFNFIPGNNKLVRYIHVEKYFIHV